MKLTYPTEPEIMTVTTPLGTKHAIPIWLPIGERSAPVMVQYCYAPAKRPRVRELIAEYMTEHDKGNGLTLWDLALGLDLAEDTIKQSLADNTRTFAMRTGTRYYKHPKSGIRRKLNRWYLRKESE